MSSSASNLMVLSILIYKPSSGNYHHWAFNIYSRRTQGHRIYQTEGDPNELRPTRTDADPAAFDRLVKRIGVGLIPESDFRQAQRIIRAVRMQNHVASWDCQDYVLDIMDALEGVGLLGSLPSYWAVKSAVRGMRGDVESTHDCVVNYNYASLRQQEEEQQEEQEDGDERGEEGEGEEEEENENENDDDDQPSNVRSAELVEDSSEEE